MKKLTDFTNNGINIKGDGVKNWIFIAINISLIPMFLLTFNGFVVQSHDISLLLIDFITNYSPFSFFFECSGVFFSFAILCLINSIFLYNKVRRYKLFSKIYILITLYRIIILLMMYYSLLCAVFCDFNLKLGIGSEG